MTSLESKAKNLPLLWASVVAEELIRLGIKLVCIAPGSRSTPLVAAFADRPELEKVVCQDERSAAFFALGWSRERKIPAAIITTSGSAVANLFPAIVEAANDRIPLLILTADRPPELRAVGANQTIDQTKIFANYVRWFADLPVPCPQVPLRFLLASVDEAAHKALLPLPGPVHLNFMFREPFVPDYVEDWDKALLDPIAQWVNSPAPLKQYYAQKPVADSVVVTTIAQLMQHAETGVIVVGAINDEKAERALLRLAENTGWPLLPDVLSNLRFSKSPSVVNYADLSLLNPKLASMRSDVIVQVGGRLVSKRLQQYLDSNRSNAYVFIDDHCDRLDPGNGITHGVQTQIAPFLDELGDYFARLPISTSGSHHLWHESRQVVERELKTIDEGNSLSELKVARSLVECLSEEHVLFASSSMPIRDLNFFAASKPNPPRLLANRGASGIDGIISTACGVSKSSQKRVVLLTGDLTFLHDTNGLALLHSLDVPMVIVVVNNQGGGIFTMLDIHRQKEIFTPYFDAEHNVQMSHLCQAHKIPYRCVETLPEWNNVLAKLPTMNVHQVVEVKSDKWKNKNDHEHVRMAISARFSV